MTKRYTYDGKSYKLTKEAEEEFLKNFKDSNRPDGYGLALQQFKEEFQLCKDYPYCQFDGCVNCKYEAQNDQ
jgi:hypothetical protein